MEAARTDTEQPARAITGRPIPRRLARSQFHRTGRGRCRWESGATAPYRAIRMVGFNARRPKPHDYRNGKTRNARGNCDFELAPKGVLLVAQSCFAAYFISPDHDLKPLMKGAACPVRFQAV